MKNLTIVATLFAALFIVACGNNTDTTEKNGDKEKMEEESASESGISIGNVPASPTYDNAVISSVKYENGTFTYKIPEGEYELGQQTSDADTKMCANSSKGQHIHLIVDNEPYTAHYVPEFDYEFEDGTHHILTFLSRSYHQSIKTDEANRAMKVNVKNGAFENMSPISQPMLFYSRPKGTYVGDDTKKVLLDFYPVNAPLGQAYKVKVEVNGDKNFTISEWKSYYLTGLPMGENTIKLTLLDRKGDPVDAPLNPVSRTITLKADPADSM